MSFPSDDKESPRNPEQDPGSNSRPGPGATAAFQSKPREKRPNSAIELLKEDFGLFKQDLINIFKDKDGKNSEAKDKTPLNVLLKDDLDQFKNELTNFSEDISGIFWKGQRKEENAKVKAQEQKGQHSENAEKDAAFKIKDQEEVVDGDDAKSFKIKAQEQMGLCSDTGKEDAFKLKACEQEEQSENAEKLESFKINVHNRKVDQDNQRASTIKARDQNEQGEDAKSDDCFKAEANKQEDATEIKGSFKIKAHNKDRCNRKEGSFKVKAQDGDESSDNEGNSDEFFVEGWELVERHEVEQNGGQFLENSGVNKKDFDPKEPNMEEMERDGGPDSRNTGSKMTDSVFSKAEELVMKQPLISLSSEISLLRLRGITKNKPCCQLKEDVWAVKNFAQYLTLDPNTANSELLLSDGNRSARRVWSCDHVTAQLTDHMTHEHPERFDCCPQVLCREGLLDAVYWEVQWTGGADVGVTYNSITRSGRAADGLLGHSRGSWSLECSQGSYTPCHQQRRFKSVCPEPFSHTVGVFLDFEAGALSFYCVSPSSMQLLHTFRATFTEPLYPGFWLWSWGGTVRLSQVELGWERLLQ